MLDGQAYNGINSGHGVLKSIGLMSTNGIIDGLKMVHIKLFEASVEHLLESDQLDTSYLHGDGSNTVVQKGVTMSASSDLSEQTEH